MKGKLKILCPVRFDSSAPIQTIHREIAYRLQSEFIFLGLIRGNNNLSLPALHSPHKIDSEWSRFKRAIQILRLYSNKHDIIHTGASGLKSHRFLVQFAKKRGASHIHTVHTVTPNNHKRQRWLVNNADVVTTVSPFVAEWIENECQASVDEIIPNGVDLTQFRPDRVETESGHILFVGRLVERKNPKLIIELAKHHGDVNFTVRGDGPLRSQLGHRAPPNVRYLGRLPTDELADIYSRAEVVICPYEKEGFGMVVIEAMASGTPVVGLNSGNLSSLITEESGELCSTLDIDEWSQTVSRVRDSIDQYDPCARARDFTWDQISQRYKQVYDDVLKTNR
jgi:glycosyltransferase involved in cell wall biosynthesis